MADQTIQQTVPRRPKEYRPVESKVCPRCVSREDTAPKPACNFQRNKSRVDGLSYYCKNCCVEMLTEFRSDPHQRKKHNSRVRRRYAVKAEQPGFRASHTLQQRKRTMLRDFNLSWDEYERLVAEQHGLCKICDKPPSEGKPLQVDHCHVSGTVRGLLCLQCNAGIGLLGDSADLLQRAARYLQAAVGM